MKQILAIVMVLALVLTGVAFAEEVDLTGYSDEQLNELMGKITDELTRREETVESLQAAEGEPLYPQREAGQGGAQDGSSDEEAVEPGFTTLMMDSRGEYVAALQEKLIELGCLGGKADGIFGPKTQAALMGLQKALGFEETGEVETEDDLNAILAVPAGDGVNLAVGTSDEWSEWMSPEYGEDKQWFYLGYAYPGEKRVGDYYTCQVEIEFRDVKAGEDDEDKKFSFYTGGPVDESWENSENLWNRKLVYLEEAPKDGSQRYVATVSISKKNVDSEQFTLGFRCAYWEDGSFRVRRIKVEKGVAATEWSLAEADKAGDGVNLATGTEEAVTVTPHGEDSWCTPGGLFKTSEEGLARLADKANLRFTVSFDWEVTGADTAVNGTICLKYTDKTYTAVGSFAIPEGDSSGHFSGAFAPNQGMREFGGGWLISGMGKGEVNRNAQVTISSFKFEVGGQETK